MDVTNKNLGGIQLFAERGETTFFDDYIITGVPRFILLDKESKIIDSDAKRPSNSELKEQLLELLK